MASGHRPVYHFGGDRGSITSQTEDNYEETAHATGNIDSDFQGARDRTSSMTSIVSKQCEEETAYGDSDSDIETAWIDDSKPVTRDDAVINLSLSSSRLKWLRFYLEFITFQWYPQNASIKRKAFWAMMQCLIVIFFCICYAYDMGAFHNRSLIEEELKETVTAAKNIVWSLRYLEMYILGLYYFRKRHLERMLTEVILTRRYWKKVRRTIFKTGAAVLIGVFVVPVFSRVTQMNITTEKVESFDLKEIVLSLIFSVLARLVALPIFIVFIFEVYIIFSRVRFFKEQVQKWREGKEKIRNRFIDIKITIRRAERAFQPFLLIHLLLLLILLIPSIFSFAERIQTESYYKQTYTDQAELTRARETPRDPNIIVDIGKQNYSQPQQLAIYLRLADSKVNKNTTQSQAFKKHTVSKTDGWMITKIICGALADFLEMLVLYSLPIVFLAKLHKIMTSLPEVVQDLKYSEQREGDYLFDDDEILNKVKGYLENGRGIRILGIDLTGVKAVLLTLLMPFLTTAIHLLFVHVDLN